MKTLTLSAEFGSFSPECLEAPQRGDGPEVVESWWVGDPILRDNSGASIDSSRVNHKETLAITVRFLETSDFIPQIRLLS